MESYFKTSLLSPEEPFLVLEPLEKVPSVDSFVDWIKANRDQLIRSLYERKALLFRSIPLSQPLHFDAFVKALNLPAATSNYIGGTAPGREKVTEDVYTANNTPPNQKIGTHHEMSYLKTRPNFVIFSPFIIAQEGGETPIVNSGKALSIMQQEKPEYLEKLIRKKISYRRLFTNQKNKDKSVKMGAPLAKSWQEAFHTEDPKEVEKLCPNFGFPIFSWTEDEDLIVQSPPYSPTEKHPITGEEIWFVAISYWDPRTSLLYTYSTTDYSDNSAAQKLVDTLSYDELFKISEHSVLYGDDNQPVDLEISQYIDNLTGDRNRVVFQWKLGDILVLDNYAVAHARNQYRGDRILLVSLR